MSTKAELKADDWIVGFDGIGELISLHTLYVEEFHDKYFKGAKLGAHYFTRAHYKIFCDVDGALRKRSHFKDCNAEYCKPVDSDTENMIERLIEEHPDNYSRYKKVKPKKNLNEKTELWLHIDDALKHEVIAELDRFSASNSGPFTYPDIIKHTNGAVKEFILNPYSFNDKHERSNLLITLINTDSKVKDKRQVFSAIRYFLRG